MNDNKIDNRLCTLPIIMGQNNCKKSANKRDYSFTAKNHQNRKYIIPTV